MKKQIKRVGTTTGNQDSSSFEAFYAAQNGKKTQNSATIPKGNKVPAAKGSANNSNNNSQIR